MPEFASPPAVLALWGVIAYLLGSVPSGVLVARVFGLGNLRDIGSGNIGATNVLRTGSKKAAALTLLMDAGKGVLAVLLAGSYAGADAAQVAGFAALLGHCFPVWLRFHGGKGVATFFGVLFALAWPLGLIAGAFWLITAFAFRFSSLGALVAAVVAALAAILGVAPTLFGLTLALGAMIFWRHRTNIQRLIARTESKIGAK